MILSLSPSLHLSLHAWDFAVGFVQSLSLHGRLLLGWTWEVLRQKTGSNLKILQVASSINRWVPPKPRADDLIRPPLLARAQETFRVRLCLLPRMVQTQRCWSGPSDQCPGLQHLGEPLPDLISFHQREIWVHAVGPNHWGRALSPGALIPQASVQPL